MHDHGPKGSSSRGGSAAARSFRSARRPNAAQRHSCAPVNEQMIVAELRSAAGQACPGAGPDWRRHFAGSGALLGLPMMLGAAARAFLAAAALGRRDRILHLLFFTSPPFYAIVRAVPPWFWVFHRLFGIGFQVIKAMRGPSLAWPGRLSG